MKIGSKNEWPFLITAFIMCMNVEVVMAPIIFVGWWGLQGISLRIAILTATIIETSYWFWFMGWLFGWIKGIKAAHSVKETVREAIDFGKSEIMPEIKGTNIPIKIQDWFRDRIINGPLNIEKHRRSKIFKLAKSLICSGAYVTVCMTLFAVSLFPFIWYPGLAVVRAVNFKVGFVFILAGNIIKNIGLVEFVVLPLLGVL